MPGHWFRSGRENVPADRSATADLPAGWTLGYVDEIDSTNAELLRRIAAGTVADRESLVAGHQTAGRGRLDRHWEERRGEALLISTALLTPPDPPSLVTRAAGLAVLRLAQTIRPANVPTPTLKWPNDVLLGGRKLAGILAQRAGGGAVVLGVGVNVFGAPDRAASLFAGRQAIIEPDRVPASLAAVARRYLGALAELLDPAPASAVGGGDEPTTGAAAPQRRIADRYRRSLSTIGQDVRVSLPGDRVLEGVAVDVDDDGRLVVAGADSTRHVLDVGDVVHLRPA